MKYGLSLLQKTTVFAFILFLAFSSLFQAATTQASAGVSGQAVEAQQKKQALIVEANRVCESDINSAECKQAKKDAGLAENNNISTDCSITSWIGLAGCITGFIYIFTIGLGSAVAYVAASFLNLAVHISLSSGAYSLDFVSLGWTTARDIANMMFIFILVYLALIIMFQANTAHTMHTLAQVILVALFINFSFFLTRVVIDAGNILGVQFYNAIVANGAREEVAGNTPLAAGAGFGVEPLGSVGPTIYIPDLTASIMQGLNLQSALNSESFKRFAESSNKWDGFFSYTIALSFLYISLGAMFFMLSAAFLTAGVKFLVRIVYLWFMIIAAPLALVARVSGLHMFDKYYFQWRNALLSHAIYPVAFLFVFWILSQFMESLSASQYLNGLFENLANTTSTGIQDFIPWMARFLANLGLRLGFVIALLYVAIKASETLSVYGSGFADKFGQTFSLGGLSGYRSRLPFLGKAVAAPAVLGASGLAYGGNALLRNSGLMLKNDPRGAAARKLGGGLQALSNASTGVLPSAAGVGKFVGNIGQGNKDRVAIENALKGINRSTGLTVGEKAALNQVNAKTLGLLSSGDLTKLANAQAFDDAMLKKIHDSKDVGDENKHAVEHVVEHQKLEGLKKSLDEIAKNTTIMVEDADNHNTLTDLKVILSKGNELSAANAKNIKSALLKVGDETKAELADTKIRMENAARMAGPAGKAAATAAKKDMTEANTTQRNVDNVIKKMS